MAFDGHFERPVGLDGLHDEFTAEACGRTDVSLLETVRFGMAEVVVACDSFSLCHWEPPLHTGLCGVRMDSGVVNWTYGELKDASKILVKMTWMDL